MSQPKISLRNLLIGFVAVGAVAGVVGRMYVRSPQLLSFLLAFFATVVPFALAEGTIIVLSWRQRNRGLALWGISLILVPILCGLGSILVQYQAVVSPNDLTRLDADTLIAGPLVKQVNEPWGWRELNQRLGRGELSAEQIDAAIQVLVQHMKQTKPQGWDAPLTWQREFLSSARRAKAVSPETTIELGDAFFGPKPRLNIPARIRAGEGPVRLVINYGSVWANHDGPGVNLVWDVKAVLLDGKPVSVAREMRSNDSWRGRLESPVPAGRHRVEVQLDAAYLDPEIATRLPIAELAPDQWPQPVKRWQPTVAGELQVLTAEENVLTLIVDAARNPSRSLRVERAFVHRDRNGRRHLTVTFGEPVDSPISFSFDVNVKIGETVVRTGTFWNVVEERDGQRRSGMEQRVVLPDEISSAANANITLTPNPRAIEHIQGAKEIWGDKLILRGIPLERLDVSAP